MLLWLWCRLAAAAPIRPLAWELPWAEGAGLKKKSEKIKNKKIVELPKKKKKSASHVLIAHWVWVCTFLERQFIAFTGFSRSVIS